MQDETRLDTLSRLAAGATSRRLALGMAAAVGGLALVGDAEAGKNDASAEKWRRKRGRRGRRGKKGPQGPGGPGGPSGPTGPDGPPAGATVEVVTKKCTFPDGNPSSDDIEIGDTDTCVIACPEGYVATGGGFEGASITTLGRVRSSYPDLNNDDLPVGWITVVEFVQTPWEFEVITYAICVPE